MNLKTLTTATTAAAFAITAVLAAPIIHADDPCIISDGTDGTGINSGYCWGPLSRVEVDFAFDATTPVQMRIVGADTDATSAKMSFYITGTGDTAFGFNYADDNTAFSGHYTGRAADTSRHVIVADQKNKKAYYINQATGVTNTTLDITGTPSVTSGIPLGLFGNANVKRMSTGFKTSNNSAKARIYRAKFYTDDVLVRDLVPLVKGGKPGFRDLVSGVFVTADGNTSLAALSASDETPVENDDGYVSTLGNDYNRGANFSFDTGYVPNERTRAELDYALAADYPQEGWVDGHEWYLFDGFSQGRFGIAYYRWAAFHWSLGKTRYSTSFSPSQGMRTANETGVRRTAILDAMNLASPVSIVTAGFTNIVAAEAGTSLSELTGSTSLKIASSYDKSLFAPLKIYGLKIYEGGELLRDYVPMMRDGVPGLLDTRGNGGFISPPFGKLAPGWGGAIASEGATDSYLESDGTQGINTGYLMKGLLSRIECDFAFTDCRTNATGTTGYQQRVFGQDAGDNLQYSLFIDHNGLLTFSLGNTFLSQGPWTGINTKRRTAIIDGYHNRLCLITGVTTNEVIPYSGVPHSNNGTWPMGVFATVAAQDASTWQNPSKMRLYSLRVYESDVLVHEYLPYCTNGVACLYDAVDEVALCDARGGNAFRLGGMGVDGEERWVVVPHDTKIRKGDAAKTLVAGAAGATSYRWTKNGEAIEGGENGELTVEWASSGATDIYAATAVYDVYGTETMGSSVSAEVENLSEGTTIILR